MMNRFSYKKNELNHLDNICREIKDDTFAERVNYNLRWYIYKARRVKFFYYFFNCINIFLPLTVSFINTLYCKKNDTVMDILLIIIPLCMSLFTSLSILFRFLEKWNSYRTAVTEINLFLDKYIDCQNTEEFDDQKKLDLHKEFSKIINEEYYRWKEVQNRRNENS